MAYANGRAVVVGAVSFGPEVCGSGDYPGVYTRVVSHMDWITEMTGLGRTTLGTCNGNISFSEALCLYLFFIIRLNSGPSYSCR